MRFYRIARDKAEIFIFLSRLAFARRSRHKNCFKKQPGGDIGGKDREFYYRGRKTPEDISNILKKLKLF